MTFRNDKSSDVDEVMNKRDADENQKDEHQNDKNQKDENQNDKIKKDKKMIIIAIKKTNN